MAEVSNYTVPFTGSGTAIATDYANTATANTGVLTASNGLPIATNPSATTGRNDPQGSMYANYSVGGYNGSGTQTDARTTITDATAANYLNKSLAQNVYDPWGPITRPEGGRQYRGGWVDPYDTTAYNGSQYRDPNNGLFKYNQMLMTVAQSFDPFMQKKEMERPHWWLNRIPRAAYKLFDGAVHETRLYRGGLTTYAGLSDWEDLAPDPTQKDACAPMNYRTYQYAWEARAWSGKKTAWGSDPICLDVFRFTPHAIEQLGWILETGVKFGTDIQNVWNRDMFIYHSVMAGRSYVMTSAYRGADSPRYVYEPYCKFDAADGQGSELHAEKSSVDRPFVVVDASQNVEPLNFEVLDIFRRNLERQCPEAAVGTIGGSRMFALAVSDEDVEKYIRGNEEERRYWIEANPQALIKGFGFAPTTFRRWTITCDTDQLRFKYKAYIPAYTSDVAKKYGYVGFKEMEGKPVYIATFVAPEIGKRAGINGAPIPEANPEYDLAELAIAPVFMNQVFTNQFVPDTPSLGNGTWFGPKKGLNGRWGWYNVQTKENLEQKIGNFYGIFEIVPKPEPCAIYASSFIYRRCAQPLPSYCPSENRKINIAAKDSAKVEKSSSGTSVGNDWVGEVTFNTPLFGAETGAMLTIGSQQAVVLDAFGGEKFKVQVIGTGSGSGAASAPSVGDEVLAGYAPEGSGSGTQG